MRTYIPLTQALFAKDGDVFSPVALPHTWNALDGQDGGNDYWRGTGHYEITLPTPTAGLRQYVEFQGANHKATVWCNGSLIGSHEGGFSTFRFDLTAAMKADNNTLRVDVSNAVSHIYPQDADFTFFGGLYRDISFIEVPDAHFDLLKDGSDAVFVSAYSGGCTRADIFPVNAHDCRVELQLLDAVGNTVFSDSQIAKEHTYFVTEVENPHLWQGVKDPYLYRAVATLTKDGEVLDQVTVTYGYRSFRIDADQGFFLNGQSTPLRGVCRHQDRQDKGWAISKADHLEDAQMIREIGANTIRLAHYQHDRYFYDLCDQMGFAVWAEVPYISSHIPGEAAHTNILNQMKELIAQCYNHPSIVVWGIGNEITIRKTLEEQFRTLHDLNALAKTLDPGRLTTIAQLTRVPLSDQQIHITDVQSFNYYYGWYFGNIEDNGPVLDKFHATHPDIACGVSEYGVENILTRHSATPFNHDYTEEYANHYHHELLKVFETRPYLWATHVWNMFDFAVDFRDEGGVKGRNNKGLVTYDRKVKKDAFYIYQAYWSDKPMVHIAGRRFANRAPGERDVTVYTNCDSVTLLLNGEPYATMDVKDHAVVFPQVPLDPGENTLTAVCGEISDTITLWGAQEHDTAYDLPDLIAARQAGNWFDTQNALEDYGEDGYHSTMPIRELLANPQCFELTKAWMMSLEHVPFENRFRFVTSIKTLWQKEAYNWKSVRQLQVPSTYATQEDFVRLDKLLRSVKKI